MTIDFRKRVTMPIRDMEKGGAIYCLVDIYGVTPMDLAVIGSNTIGSKPLRKAVERLGLDPKRYRSSIWDVPV